MEEQQEQQQQSQPEQTQERGEQKETWVTKLKDFWKECLRVLKVTKKPSRMEFQTIVKASGAGILVIGLIGFIVQMAQMLFFK